MKSRYANTDINGLPIGNITHEICMDIKDCFAIFCCSILFCFDFFLTVVYSLSRDKNEASKENQVKLQLKKSHEGK